MTSDAQLLHFPADAVRPQGRSGGGIAGIKLASGEPRRCCSARVDPGRPPSWSQCPARRARCPAPSRQRQGDAVRRVPRQGPRHGRRALPPVPQGRGPAAARLGRRRPGAGGGQQRRPRRPAGADRPARRLRRARRSRSPRWPARSRERLARGRIAMAGCAAGLGGGRPAVLARRSPARRLRLRRRRRRPADDSARRMEAWPRAGELDEASGVDDHPDHRRAARRRRGAWSGRPEPATTNLPSTAR